MIKQRKQFPVWITIRKLSLLLAVLLLACTRSENYRDEWLSTPTPPSPSVAFSTLSANPLYMSGCMEISNTITTDQVAFLAVLPGVSTKKQVEATLGTPESPSQYVPSVWAYRDLGVNLTFSTNDEGNEIVKSITASGELYGESLEEIIQEFGCPSAIIGFKYSLHDVQSKNYTDLTLIYLEGGIAFHFPPSILNIREKPIGLHYFIPGTFDEYIMNYMGSVDLSIVKLFDWEEVVRLEP